MKKAVIVSLTMLVLCVSVTGLRANNLFLPLVTKDQGELTGRWEGVRTTGEWVGAFGLLLRQSGSLVTATFGSLQLSYVEFVNGVLTCTLFSTGQTWDWRFTLSADKQTLDGTIIVHKSGKADQTIPITFNRLSNDPTYPDLTPPVVEQITLLPPPPYVISIRWSKPMVGWTIQLKTYIGGISRTLTDNSLVDKTLFAYNPQTYTWTMPILPTIVPDPGAASTLSLCPGAVLWASEYGIPPWPNCSQATPINFNWPNL
jgi:hypothetical protein